MTRTLTPSALMRYAATIIAAPNGMSYDEFAAAIGKGQKYSRKLMWQMHALGLVAQTHRGSIRSKWTTPDRVEAIRTQIDMATPTRTLRRKARRAEMAKGAVKPPQVEAPDDPEVDAWMETQPRHIVGQAWETPKPPGPRSIFEVAACR